MRNLSGMCDRVNQQVANIATQVGQTPQGWNGSIFSMIQNLSNSIMVPIAGVILAIVMTLELIQMITDKNNLNRSEEHTSELQSRFDLVCRLLLEKKKKNKEGYKPKVLTIAKVFYPSILWTCTNMT